MASTRRRPTHRKGRATLTRESIGRAALELLNRRGPTELTMRALAEELGVSARAIYNYVEDRHDLIVLIATIFEAGWRVTPLRPEHWREDLRGFCRELRAHYRRHPGMTTLALSENITSAQHPNMLRNVDGLVGLYVEVGLTLRDSYRACMETIRLVVGFVEFQDSFHDRPPAHLDPEDLNGVPPSWLEAPPEMELPYLRRAAGELEPDHPDALFGFALDLLIEGLEAKRLSARDPSPPSE